MKRTKKPTGSKTNSPEKQVYVTKEEIDFFFQEKEPEYLLIYMFIRYYFKDKKQSTIKASYIQKELNLHPSSVFNFITSYQKYINHTINNDLTVIPDSINRK